MHYSLTRALVFILGKSPAPYRAGRTHTRSFQVLGDQNLVAPS